MEFNRSSVFIQNIVRAAPVNANGKTQFSTQFPMGPGYYETRIRLNIAVTIGTGAGPVAEGELNYLRQINYRTDLGETIVDNLPARALYKIAAYKSGAPPRKDAIAAATATYRIDIPIYHADPRAQRPEDTVLNTSRYNSITLDLVTGPLTDLFTAPGTATVAITCDIDVVRSKGRWPAEAGVIGFTQYSARPVVDAASVTTIDLERASDLRYKRLFLHASTSGTAGMPWYGANSDAIIDVINLRDSDDNHVKDRTWAMVQDENKDFHGLETALAGVTMFDFCRDGSNGAALYSGDKSMLQLSWTNQGAPGANSIVTLVTESRRDLRKAA